MIVETILTKYLKRKYNSTLNFTTFSEVAPPVALPGTPYLLYVHIPFCEELCPYCSFNRFKFDGASAKSYFHALSREILMYRDMGFDFDAVYVGGGTPTVLPEEMANLLLDIKTWFGVATISLETNPNHLTDPVLSMMKQAGVNRLSVGVQSFDDSLLKQMERYHKYGSGREIKEKVSHYMGTFDTLNVDMIFNFPTQTLDMLNTDLEIIKEIRADQATFYPLMVSDTTRRVLAERFGAISYRQEQFFYETIVSRLLPEYSFGTAWCFSKQKSMIDEYIVDHDEYVGAGSGSFGYVRGTCFANTFSLDEYVSSIHRGKVPLTAKRDFSLREQVHYYFMMKLFGSRIDLREAEIKFNGHFEETIRKEIFLLRFLGALDVQAETMRLTNKGRYFWVIMMREFFTGVNNFRDLCRATMKGPDDCMD